MFRPTMNETYRRNGSLANAKWGSLSGPTPIQRQSMVGTTDRETTTKESRIRPKWIQSQQDLDAASSLLLMTKAMQIRNQRNKRAAMSSLKNSRNRSLSQFKQQQQQIKNEKLQKLFLPLPKSLSIPKSSSVLDSLRKQQQQDRWLELLPTRPKSMGSMIRGKPPRKFPSGTTDELKWNERIKEVKEFVREHGHGRIPVNYPQNQELARWSKRQRYHYKVFLKNQQRKLLTNSDSDSERCHMTHERLQSLNEAGFCFDLHVARWDRNYQLLKRSKSCPTQHKNAELKKWIGTQRFQMSLLKRGGKSCLNPERIQKLNDIGFAWNDDREWLRNKNKNNTTTPSTSFFPVSNQNRPPQRLQTSMEIAMRGLQLLNAKEPTMNCQDQQQRDDTNAAASSSIKKDSVPMEIVLVQQPSDLEEEDEETTDTL